MARTSRTVRDDNPRLHLKVMRNHLPESSQTPLSAPTAGFYHDRVVQGLVGTKPLSAAVRASEQSRRYRFGWINAVFNPTKVLRGDDPNRVSGDREWLDT